MPQQITVNDETWNRLKALAEPLIDTVDDVIIRLLDSADSSEPQPREQSAETLDNSSEDFEDRITDQMINRRAHVREVDSVRADYGRLPRGLRLEVEAYRRPILQVLEDMGGRGRPIQLLPAVKKRLESRMSAFDLETLTTGGPRWEKSAHWARFALVEDGYLDGSEHGWWKITPKGRSALKNGDV